MGEEVGEEAEDCFWFSAGANNDLRPIEDVTSPT